MKILSKRVIAPAAVGLIGGIGGWLIYRFIGCASGACPITASPYLSVIFGVVIGASLGLNVGQSSRKEDGDDA